MGFYWSPVLDHFDYIYVLLDSIWQFSMTSMFQLYLAWPCMEGSSISCLIFPQNEYQGGLTFVKTVKLYVYLFKKLTSPSQLLPLLDHCASPPESLQKQEQRHNPLNTAGMLIHPQLAKNIPCHVKKCLETVYNNKIYFEGILKMA